MGNTGSNTEEINVNKQYSHSCEKAETQVRHRKTMLRNDYFEKLAQNKKKEKELSLVTKSNLRRKVSIYGVKINSAQEEEETSLEGVRFNHSYQGRELNMSYAESLLKNRNSLCDRSSFGENNIINQNVYSHYDNRSHQFSEISEFSDISESKFKNDKIRDISRTPDKNKKQPQYSIESVKVNNDINGLKKCQKIEETLQQSNTNSNKNSRNISKENHNNSSNKKKNKFDSLLKRSCEDCEQGNNTINRTSKEMKNFVYFTNPSNEMGSFTETRNSLFLKNDLINDDGRSHISGQILDIEKEKEKTTCKLNVLQNGKNIEVPVHLQKTSNKKTEDNYLSCGASQSSSFCNNPTNINIYKESGNNLAKNYIDITNNQHSVIKDSLRPTNNNNLSEMNYKDVDFFNKSLISNSNFSTVSKRKVKNKNNLSSSDSFISTNLKQQFDAISCNYYDDNKSKSPGPELKNTDLNYSIAHNNTTMYNEYDLNYVKNGEELRKSYMAKLIYKKIWKPSKEKDHNTMIIFDWDDTLLCTSFLTPNGVFDDEMELSEKDILKIAKLEFSALRILTAATEKGDTFIITNAAPGWVEYSSKRFYPSVYKILNKVKIISARGDYEKHYPGDSRMWKIQAFSQMQKNFDNNLVTNIICLGDSFIEMEAGHVLASKFTQAFIKTIKFRESPKPEELNKQLSLVADQFNTIYSAIKNLTIRVEKKVKR
jgi:hypothetical protein